MKEEREEGKGRSVRGGRGRIYGEPREGRVRQEL